LHQEGSILERFLLLLIVQPIELGSYRDQRQEYYHQNGQVPVRSLPKSQDFPSMAAK